MRNYHMIGSPKGRSGWLLKAMSGRISYVPGTRNRSANVLSGRFTSGFKAGYRRAR